MRLISFKTGVLVSAINLFGCQQQPLTALKIGDRVPNILLENIINYSGAKAHLGDFKGKLLILDFWATWCHPCVQTIPRLEQLQNQFGNQIQILMVTSQPGEAIAKFFSGRSAKLPSVTGDQNLSKMFPHKYVPHEVWIKDGKVLAITGEAEVTSANIKAILSDEKAVMGEKKSNFNYDLTQPLLFNGNGGRPSDLLYHSVFTGYLDGIGGGGVYTDSLNRFKIRALNGTVLQLYQAAMRFSDHRELARTNRCVLDFDKQKILPPADVPPYAISARDSYYCYELIVPNSLKEQAGGYMLEDLNRIFGARYQLHADIERQIVKCWAIRKTAAFKSLASQSATPEISFDEPGRMVYRKQPFSKFCETVAGLYRHDPFPVIDQTGITGDIDISFPTKEKDIRTFSADLEKYGLCLVQDSRPIDMLVIKQLN